MTHRSSLSVLELGPGSGLQVRPAAVVRVEVSAALSDVTRALIGGGAFPQPALGVAVLDTGASHSCIDEQAAAKAGIRKAGTIRSSTPIYQGDAVLMQARVVLPEVAVVLADTTVIVAHLADHFASMAHGPEPIIALIGRDILERCVFTYDGPGAAFSISA